MFEHARYAVDQIDQKIFATIQQENHWQSWQERSRFIVDL